MQLIIQPREGFMKENYQIFTSVFISPQILIVSIQDLTAQVKRLDIICEQ